MDLDQDTMNSLDWPAVLAALAAQARTPMGQRAALALVGLTDATSIRTLHDQVDEVLLAEGDTDTIPVGGVLDVADAVRSASKAAVLEKADLRAVGRTLEQLHQLADWLQGCEANLPWLAGLVPVLAVDAGARDTLVRAFDPMGDLSAAAFPELSYLRQRIQDLHVAVRRTLEQIVSSDEMADALQDRFVTQRGDRYVIPVKVGWKRKDMGIVHGMSSSGQTAFIEPTQVIALNNDLRIAEGELEAAERRILTQLSGVVGRLAGRLFGALEAATAVDLAVARASLGRLLRASRPVVKEDGVVALKAARHPLLALRGLEVVANDLRLDSAQPALVISGPNTGGKTVALKTLGVCALLVRIGCFVPAEPGSRVDCFSDVLALIGDHQTVQGDHSSFSSHLAALKHMLDRAGPGCLYLVDEIASGTDPQQGAALAHAWLEALIGKGPRAVITTHFHRLKTVGATDRRFAMAGMQFAEGRPTFRLLTGISGESHALDIARRIGLGPAVLERTRQLMGEDEQSLADVLTALEHERTRAEEATLRLERLERAAAERAASLAEREETIRRKAKELEQQHASAFLGRLEAAAQAIGAVVADLQRDPSHKKAEAARAAVDALRALAPVQEAPSAPQVEVGSRVKLRVGGRAGEVVSLDDRQAQVRIGGLLVRAKLEELELVAGKVKKAQKPAPVEATRPDRKVALDDAVRLPGNTVDLRGLRVEEGLEAIDRFFGEAQARSLSTVFILHGHGTGAMKDGVRRFLGTCPYVGEWCPASAAQGGDAYSVVALR